MDKHETLEPLIELFEQDGFKVDPEDRTDRRVWMTHRMGRGFWVDLDNYGVTVVMGAGHWGKGADLEEAKRNFRAAGGHLTGGYSILRFNDNTLFLGIDGMGSYQWLGDAPEVEHRGKGRKA